MSGIRKTLQALLGALLAAAAALAAGNLVFPRENDLIAAVHGFRVSAAGIGAGLSLLTVLAFADGWIGAGRRSRPEEAGAGRFLNGIGFGLLPGIAVWKAFEQYTALGRGTPVAEGIPAVSFFTADGAWLPVRLELTGALVLFALIVIWLAARKQEIPENGDVLGVSLAAWSVLRMLTEQTRAEQIGLLGESRVAGWIFAAAACAVLIWWTVRTIRQKRNTGYALICVPVFAAALAGIVMIQNRVMLSGNAPAQLVVQLCLALLAVKAVLCMGRVSR